MLTKSGYVFITSNNIVMKDSTFISYSRADASFALQLANDLRATGVNTWLDQMDIPQGSHWDNAIETALDSATCVLAIISARLIASKTAMDEVSYALEQNKKVILVLLDNTETSFRLRKLQRVDFTGDYSKAFNELLQILASTSVLITQKNNNSDEIRLSKDTSSKSQRKKLSTLAFASIVLSAAIAWTVVKLVNKPGEVPLNRDIEHIRVVTGTADSIEVAGKEIQATEELPYVEIVKPGAVKPAQDKIKIKP